MDSTYVNHFPVIIVGAGPVGLTTAINIARLKIKVAVLERGDKIDQSPRAASYQPCAQAELLETGILDDIKNKSAVNNVLSFWVGSGPEKNKVASVKKLEGGDLFPAGINCPQPVLTETLLEYVTSHYDSKVHFRQRIADIHQSDDIVTVLCTNPHTDKETVYTCNWLVGADGAGSSVRKLLGIDFEGFTWPKEEFVATNIRYPFYKYGFTTANFLMDPVYWAVTTILDSTGLWRCSFGTKPGMTNDEIRAKLDDYFKHILPGWPGEGYELVELNKYKPHQRCAKQFRRGRCLLVGDAAHSNNPIGGLGLTTGLLDAGPLGRALGAVVNGKAPVSILDTWAESRRQKWLSFTNEFSIENKRMVQQGGYSNDPLEIWKIDDVAREHGMEKLLQMATPDKREADIAFYKALEDPQIQLMTRMKQWDITMDPLWMAQYEDPEVVKYRVSLRPASLSAPAPNL